MFAFSCEKKPVKIITFTGPKMETFSFSFYLFSCKYFLYAFRRFLSLFHSLAVFICKFLFCLFVTSFRLLYLALRSFIYMEWTDIDDSIICCCCGNNFFLLLLTLLSYLLLFPFSPLPFNLIYFCFFTEYWSIQHCIFGGWRFRFFRWISKLKENWISFSM